MVDWFEQYLEIFGAGSVCLTIQLYIMLSLLLLSWKWRVQASDKKDKIAYCTPNLIIYYMMWYINESNNSPEASMANSKL